MAYVFLATIFPSIKSAWPCPNGTSRTQIQPQYRNRQGADTDFSGNGDEVASPPSAAAASRRSPGLPLPSLV